MPIVLTPHFVYHTFKSHLVPCSLSGFDINWVKYCSIVSVSLSYYKRKNHIEESITTISKHHLLRKQQHIWAQFKIAMSIEEIIAQSILTLVKLFVFSIFLYKVYASSVFQCKLIIGIRHSFLPENSPSCLPIYHFRSNYLQKQIFIVI